MIPWLLSHFRNGTTVCSSRVSTSSVASSRPCSSLRTKRLWHIFEDSQDEQQAREALAALKQLPVDPTHPEPFHKVLSFLDAHFEWMTAYLRHEGVKRNSLAESGMRVLRRLEVEHDGFRSATGRSNCLRIYQAVKYLGWTVHHPFLLEPKPT